MFEIRPGDFECNLNLAHPYAEEQSAGASQAIHYFRSALACRFGSPVAGDMYLQMAELQCRFCTWKVARETREMAAREILHDEELWQKLHKGQG